MTRHFTRWTGETVTEAMLLIEVARCWRDARDAGVRVQPRLSRLLSSRNLAMLAPVFDSLLRFFEQALGRSVATGWHTAISEDEHLLLNLVQDNGRWPAALPCPPAYVDALRRAIGSARIMLTMAMGRRQGLTVPTQISA